MGRTAGQPPLPLLPGGAVPVGDAAGLVEGPAGGVVFVFGAATFAWDADDEAARRLAAVQLVRTGTARRRHVASAFGVDEATLWRWERAYAGAGLAGLLPARRGPKGPRKMTAELVERVRGLHAGGATLAAIAAATGVSTASVRRALGRGTSRWPADGAPADGAPGSGEAGAGERVAPGDQPLAGGELVPAGGELVPVAAPVPRTVERAAARAGLLEQAEPVLTQGAQLPLAGLLLVLPALRTAGLLGVAEGVYGRLRNGFYGLRATLLTLVFLALVRQPRAEGATRVPPADLGRLLGLDRAPEVKTIRRKLAELAGHRRGGQLLQALAAHHATVRAEAVGFLHVDGHVRVYSGTRVLPKTHVARMRLAAPATVETWVCDADGDPVFVLTAPPAASLAGELRRLLPTLREVVGGDRRVTVVFDRGGYSPAVFAEILAAGFDLLTYRKGPVPPLPAEAFHPAAHTDPDGRTRHYRLADTAVELPVPGRDDPLRLRQVTRIAADGHQVHILTSRADLPAAAVAYRMSSRWRQENYFKYGRAHFALDALDSYADTDDDPHRSVPNPAKAAARQQVAQARADLAAAEAALAEAIDQAGEQAARTGAGTVPATVTDAVDAARDALTAAQHAAAAIPARTTAGQVTPDGRLLDEERKLITHAVRMAAYNAESALARLLRPHYPRAEDEARALLREAFTLAGDIQTLGNELHVRLNPATAPRRSRALAALAAELTATDTRYPGTDLVLRYSIKGHPNPA